MYTVTVGVRNEEVQDAFGKKAAMVPYYEISSAVLVVMNGVGQRLEQKNYSTLSGFLDCLVSLGFIDLLVSSCLLKVAEEKEW